jgi:hypothetical protein
MASSRAERFQLHNMSKESQKRTHSKRETHTVDVSTVYEDDIIVREIKSKLQCTSEAAEKPKAVTLNQNIKSETTTVDNGNLDAVSPVDDNPAQKFSTDEPSATEIPSVSGKKETSLKLLFFRFVIFFVCILHLMLIFPLHSLQDKQKLFQLKTN